MSVRCSLLIMLCTLCLCACTEPQLRTSVREDAGRMAGDASVDADTGSHEDTDDAPDADTDAPASDPCGALDCDPRATCEAEQGDARCVCPSGFVVTPSISPKQRCEDVDECQAGTPCGDSATCVNTIGGHYCGCPAGHALDGAKECVPVGACVTGEADSVDFGVLGKGRLTVHSSRCTWECPCNAYETCPCPVEMPVGEPPTVELHPDPYTFIEDAHCSEGSSKEACAIAATGVVFRPAHNVAFVTSTLHRGNLGGFAGADEVCAKLAADAGLLGDDYRAIISGDELGNGRTRFQNARGFLRSDGLPIIDELSTNDYPLFRYPLDLDERGNRISDDAGAWTGTWSNNQQIDCLNWTSNSASEVGAGGDPHALDFRFEQDSDRSCDTERHLYCARAELFTPFSAGIEFPGRVVFVTPSAFVPGGPRGLGLTRADAACQREACRLGLTGIDDAARCESTPGSFRSFRALLSTTEQAAIERIPARAEPFIDITRHPFTLTGADLALGLTLTGLRDHDNVWGREYAFTGFHERPSELSVQHEEPALSEDCVGWTETGLTSAVIPAAVVSLWSSNFVWSVMDCTQDYGIICVEQ
jgi:hypothetical protein